MIRLTYSIKNVPVKINVVEHEDELDSFVDWIRRHPKLAYDTETTGLNIFKSDFRIRMAQFGTTREAWCIPVELGPRFAWYVQCAIKYAKQLVMHNAPFDILGSWKCLGADFQEMFDKVTDTDSLSRLWDSRGLKEGGPGHQLVDLVKILIDPVVAEEVKKSAGREAKRLRVSKDVYFQEVDIFDEAYNLYAGMDVILTSILEEKVQNLVPASARKLIGFENNLSRINAEISRTGFQLDVPYTEQVSTQLQQEETWWQLKIEDFTDDEEFSTGSTADVARVLLDLGWTEFEFTAPENSEPRIKVDDALLNRCADAGIEFAEWIRQAKKAAKWRKTWPESFLDNMDADGRCHASINTMQARTYRYSITGIPAQTLPSKAGLIRNCFVADEGHVISSIDYSNQELRVAAALANDKTLIEIFRNGGDVHQITADAAGVKRPIGKMADFLILFGGGYQALMEQGHVSEEVAKRTIKAFMSTYKGVARMKRELTELGNKQGYVETPTGRILVLDRGHGYTAMNFKIQCTARDITAAAQSRLDKAGFTPYMRLPIHDEILFSFPEKEAEAMSIEASRIMDFNLNGLDIPTEPEVGFRAWGSLKECIVTGCGDVRYENRLCQSHFEERGIAA